MASGSETKQRVAEDASRVVTAKGPSRSEDPHETAAAVMGGGDEAAHRFYSSSVSNSYRLKSELVSQHLAEIGMGRYVRSLFWSSLLALFRLGSPVLCP